jgi:two-component system KDP operon response regulator KdpE
MPDLPLIVIIEDEKPIVRFLTASLESLGYRVAVAESGSQGLSVIDSRLPDLVILDLGLPDMDGVEIIDHVRAFSQLPIVVLSARDRERDKVDALDRGADDYLAKPFGVGELAARVRVALRHRAQTVGGEGRDSSVFSSGDLRVALQDRRVFVGQKEVHLTPIEYRLLVTLCAHPGKMLTHRYLLREVWGPAYTDEVHQLRVHMANLRQKIEMEPARPRHVLTEQGVGYRLAVND